MRLRSRCQVLPNEAPPMLLVKWEDRGGGMGILSPRGEKSLLGPHKSFSSNEPEALTLFSGSGRSAIRTLVGGHLGDR